MNQRFYVISELMLSYSLKCRKNTESKKTKVQKIKNGRIMLSSVCAVYCSKKLRELLKSKNIVDNNVA